jgi:surfeit locus 1 family protein
MTFGRYQFRPSLWPTLAFLLVLPGLLALGFWQLDRAEQKRALLAQIEAARAAPPTVLVERMPEPEALRFRRVRADGRYDSDHQFLLDNQVQQGRAGYLILTPLRIRGSDYAVLVNRGWHPVGPDRSQLPEVDVAREPREIVGLATRGPSVGLRLGESGAGGEGWPRRIQYLDFDAMAAALPYRLLPLVVDPAANGSALQARLEGFGPQRHVGYAVQWFALAAALTALYGVLTISRRSVDD